MIQTLAAWAGNVNATSVLWRPLPRWSVCFEGFVSKYFIGKVSKVSCIQFESCCCRKELEVKHSVSKSPSDSTLNTMVKKFETKANCHLTSDSFRAIFESAYKAATLGAVVMIRTCIQVIKCDSWKSQYFFPHTSYLLLLSPHRRCC